MPNNDTPELFDNKIDRLISESYATFPDSSDVVNAINDNTLTIESMHNSISSKVSSLPTDKGRKLSVVTNIVTMSNRTLIHDMKVSKSNVLSAEDLLLRAIAASVLVKPMESKEVIPLVNITPKPIEGREIGDIYIDIVISTPDIVFDGTILTYEDNKSTKVGFLSKSNTVNDGSYRLIPVYKGGIVTIYLHKTKKGLHGSSYDNFKPMNVYAKRFICKDYNVVTSLTNKYTIDNIISNGGVIVGGCDLSISGSGPLDCDINTEDLSVCVKKYTNYTRNQSTTIQGVGKCDSTVVSLTIKPHSAGYLRNSYSNRIDLYSILNKLYSNFPNGKFRTIGTVDVNGKVYQVSSIEVDTNIVKLQIDTGFVLLTSIDKTVLDFVSNPLIGDIVCDDNNLKSISLTIIVDKVLKSNFNIGNVINCTYLGDYNIEDHTLSSIDIDNFPDTNGRKNKGIVIGKIPSLIIGETLVAYTDGTIVSYEDGLDNVISYN